MSKKKDILISYTNKELIIDTIVSPLNQTYFTLFNRKNKEISQLEEIEINGKIYVPIDPNSSFVTSGSILFPSEIGIYKSKEELLLKIQSYLYKYIDIPKDYRVIASYYVLLTYVYDNFSEIPYLRVIGDYGSGKSRLLKTIGSICYNPMITNGGTSLSAIFRMIEKFKGTLVIDEADMLYSDTSNEMIKLFNNGYQKGNPIMRADGEGFEPRCYEVFCPKIIGGRMEFRDKATESRCITNIMKRTNRKNLPIGLDNDFYIDSQELRNMLIKFRYDYYDSIKLKNKIIDGLEPRLNQIINPILSLVDNDEIEKVIIDNLTLKQKEIKEDRKNSLLGAILGIIKTKFNNHTEVYYKDILDSLEVIEGKINFTSKKLGSLLKQNGLKGYRKNDGTVILLEINKDELERLYNEYSIDS